VAAFELFDALQDFGKRPPTAISAEPAQASRPEVVPEPMPDFAQTIDAEVAKAEAATEERLTRDHKAALDELKLAHATEIEAMLQRFGDSAGQTIAAKIDEMESRIGEQAAAAAARILSIFLSDELQKRSIESLAQSIRAAATDREAIRIEVRGPQSLFVTLSKALGERAGEFDFIEAPGFDLVVNIDGNLFESRLSEWSTALSEILA
jgi:hypothetical protein